MEFSCVFFLFEISLDIYDESVVLCDLEPYPNKLSPSRL